MLQPESSSSSVLVFAVRAFECYVDLMHFASSPGMPESTDANLGGQLLYIGNLDENRRPLIAAANIAGAASLTASADLAVLRQAQRDGLIDFLVNSLDEALRILKNEIRKSHPVAVAVSVSSAAVEAEMLERGILPDLLPSDPPASSMQAFTTFKALGAKQLAGLDRSAGDELQIWPIPTEYARQAAAFDAILLEHLPPEDRLNRRWLRLAPRYLGAALRRYRSIGCNQQTTVDLAARFGPPIPVPSQRS